MPSLDDQTFKTGQSDSEGDSTKAPDTPLPPTPSRPLQQQPTTKAALDEEHDLAPHNDTLWAKIKIALKEPFAEMWGTFILVLFGLGGIAQVSLSKTKGGQFNPTYPDGLNYGTWQDINWAFGIGLMLGIYVAGNSGAFLNPAVTLTSCLLRKLPWRRLPMYWFSQILGAFLAAGVVYANYIDAINMVEGYGIRSVGGNTSTAGIFATYPADFTTKTTQFFEQFLASAVLMFMIFALQDDSNKGAFIASGAWFPLCLFFVMFGIAAAFGWQTGFAINMARDLGPRLWTYCVGYGTDVWSAGGYYFWIPMVAPIVGCLFGGIMYDLFIYTGESPVNQPFWGLGQIVNPYGAMKSRLRKQKEEGMV
ncbi:hypothetical protein DOTSEDRAFT_61285 [Dothistroma septosporum NZE10]|uniref:Aquaporin-like protein n=1 Tax=Dothistroma septosporum (strain NZE10 / CBS 128990) TaxID=675120 RepID=N1PWV1_DOTSN|nr:hypothetical protein DOTSEDRAFT_61285 [Dothistroma septosporum NZE10]